jgi:hypothetical protein
MLSEQPLHRMTKSHSRGSGQLNTKGSIGEYKANLSTIQPLISKSLTLRQPDLINVDDMETGFMSSLSLRFE